MYLVFWSHSVRFFPNLPTYPKSGRPLWTFPKEAFEIIKDKLNNPPILRYPDFNKEFIVTEDSSGTRCGAI